MEEGKLDSYPLSNERKIKLLNVLHVGTFRSIWSLSSGVRLIEDLKNRPVISFDPDMSEKFENLLSELGKEYPQFIEMHDDYKRAGAISPSFVRALFLDFEQLNVEDTRVRLVYLICCLQGEWRN